MKWTSRNIRSIAVSRFVFGMSLGDDLKDLSEAAEATKAGTRKDTGTDVENVGCSTANQGETNVQAEAVENPVDSGENSRQESSGENAWHSTASGGIHGADDGCDVAYNVGSSSEG